MNSFISINSQPIANCLVLCVVLLRLGDVLDPHAPVLIQLLGENGESGKIQVKPGVRPEDQFEKGKVYKLIARVGDIGKVSKNCTAIMLE